MSRWKQTAALVLVCMLIPLTASANSSWRWLSETRPYDVLPFVAVITIAVEAAALWFVLGKKHLAKIAVVVVIANLLSFAAPYLIDYLDEMRIWSMQELLDKFPSYTVRAAYLWVTLLVELPFVFLTLHKHASNKRRFLMFAVGANVATTIITAMAERIFCYGKW